MGSRPILLTTQVVALWLAVTALAVITSMTLIASATRSDCTPHSTNTSSISATDITIDVHSCTPQEKISTAVHQYARYFQSAHIIIIQTITACSLLVFKPSILATIWSALECSTSSRIDRVPTMTMAALQNGVELVSSPGLVNAVLYAKESRSIGFQVTFVFLVSILSLVSPIAVSPIYRAHTGPYLVNASIVTGGGVGPSVSASLNTRDLVSGGVSAGRALINAATILNTQVAATTFDVSVAPFLSRQTVQAIWNAQIETVVARNALDCGPSAPMRLSTSPQNLVTIDPGYFAPAQGLAEIRPLFAGQVLGTTFNDPQVTAVYLNASVTAKPGSVEAQTSVILLAANGTLEGAQQTITSPDPTSRISFIDVLVCTSTTRLEIDECTIDRGAVTACNPLQPPLLPLNASSSPTGGVETYIKSPKAVSVILSASAVTAFYSLSNILPRYDFGLTYLSSRVPPLSFLTRDVIGMPYNISLDYVTDVLFGQTAQGLVQGMVSKWQVFQTQEVQLIATFGTSQPVLTCAIMALSTVCALSATLSSTAMRSAREAVALNVGRLIAISRNPQLDAQLQVYGDRELKMGREVLDATVGYRWVESVEGVKRRALVLGPT